MAKPFTPRPYQVIGQQFIAEHKRCALWAGMGMGKTSMGLNVLDAIHNVAGEEAPSIIFAPLRVARDTWPEETTKWTHLEGFEVVPICGTPAERKAALRRDAQVFSINYENVPWLVETLGDRWRFENVIADESTKIKSFRLQGGGTRAKALAGVAHAKVKRWVNLTGTPASNGMVDLWGQTWFLDEGRRLGRTFTSFQERFFRPLRNDDGYYDWVATEYTQEQIMPRLKDICLTLDPRDWFDLRAPIITPVRVKLPPAVMRKYKEMENDFFTEIGGFDIEAFAAASKSQKLLQIAAGNIWVDRGTSHWEPIHEAKLEALDSIVSEANGMPVLCAYQWVPDRERILKAFPRAVDLATPEGMAAFRAGKSPLGIAHPQSLGHGVDGLQNVTNIIAFYSDWWALEPHDQILERIGPVRQMQAGHDRPVFVYHIVAEGTVDTVLMARHQGKRDVQDLLLEYMKGKR